MKPRDDLSAVDKGEKDETEGMKKKSDSVREVR